MNETNGHATNGEQLEDGPPPPPPIAFTYRNHRGEVGLRRVRPGCFRYGPSEWHPEGWLLDGFDVDKGADRTFAVRDILEWYALPDLAPRGADRCSCGAIRPDCACPVILWHVLVRDGGDPGGVPSETGEMVRARNEAEALQVAGTRCATGRVAVRPAKPEELIRK